MFELRVKGEVWVVRTEEEDLVRDFLRPLDVVRDTHAIVRLLRSESIENSSAKKSFVRLKSVGL